MAEIAYGVWNDEGFESIVGSEEEARARLARLRASYGDVSSSPDFYYRWWLGRFIDGVLDEGWEDEASDSEVWVPVEGGDVQSF